MYEVDFDTLTFYMFYVGFFTLIMLMTSQGSDTVTAIFKLKFISNIIKSLHLLKMA